MHKQQPEELKLAINQIKMCQRSGERAPQKPLLLLYALGRLSRGESCQMSNNEVVISEIITRLRFMFNIQ